MARQKRVRSFMRRMAGSRKKVRVRAHLRKKRVDIKRKGKGR